MYRLLDSRGGWILARSHYDEALSIAIELGFHSSIKQLRRRIIRLDLATGRISEALRTLLEAEGIAPGQEPQDPEWFDLHAEVALSSLRPATAIDFASSLLQTAQGPSAAQACLYRAKAYRMQRQLSRAISEYQRAAAGFNEAGDLAGIDECLTGELMLQVLYSGDAMEAERLLSRPVHTASTNSLRRSIFESARAFVAARKGRALDARSILMGAIGAANSPQESAMLHITGLSLRIWDDLGPAISQLIGAAADIQPASARLSLLESLSISPAWGSIAKEDRARLDQIFVYEPQDDVERAVHALLKADLLRVIGEVERALSLLAEAIPSMGQRSVESFHYVERLQAESRIRSDGNKVPARYDPALLEAFNKDGLIAAIIRMSQAEGYMDLGENALAGEVLTGVDSLLRAEPIGNMQRARYAELLEKLTPAPGIIQSEMPIPFGAQADTEQYLPPLQECTPAAVVAPSPSVSPILSRPAAPERDEEDPENLKCTLFVISASPGSNQFMTFEPPSYFKPVGLNQSPILPMLYEAAQQRIPTKLYGALAGDWMGATEQISALFHTRERSVDEPVRLLLDTSGNLAGMPWEFLPIFRGPGPMFRAPIRSQVLTATGDMGSGLLSVWKTLTRGLRAIGGNRDLTSARDALRAAPRVGPPRVMILNSGQEMRRSEAGFAYTKVADIYGNSKITLAGFDSEVNADSIEHRISEAQPEVIVIFSEMIDSPSIPEPMLATGRLLPRTLSHIAGRAMKDTPGPTIILDVPLPASPEHAIQQLHARNRFASELQRAGNVTAVIATGLGPDDDVLSIHSLLVSLMLESASLDETLDTVREHYRGSSDLRDALPYLGFAVLSNYPYQLLVPRAKPSNA
jgi:tetratricopeptide (TPR) repeat protein